MRKMLSTNTSGYTGVCFNKQTQMWRASIKKDGKTLWLGDYEAKIAAAQARKAGEEELTIK